MNDWSELKNIARQIPSEAREHSRYGKLANTSPAIPEVTVKTVPATRKDKLFCLFSIFESIRLAGIYARGKIAPSQKHSLPGIPLLPAAYRTAKTKKYATRSIRAEHKYIFKLATSLI